MLADLDDHAVFLFCDAAHCSVPDLAPTCATDSSLENYNDARYSGFLPLCKPRPFSVSFSLLVNVFTHCIVLGCFSLLLPSASFLKNCPLAPCAFLVPPPLSRVLQQFLQLPPSKIAQSDKPRFFPFSSVRKDFGQSFPELYSFSPLFQGDGAKIFLCATIR